LFAQLKRLERLPVHGREPPVFGVIAGRGAGPHGERWQQRADNVLLLVRVGGLRFGHFEVLGRFSGRGRPQPDWRTDRHARLERHLVVLALVVPLEVGGRGHVRVVASQTRSVGVSAVPLGFRFLFRGGAAAVLCRPMTASIGWRIDDGTLHCTRLVRLVVVVVIVVVVIGLVVVV